MTKIQWTEKTWNPTVGCSIISAGCRRCYAMVQAHRMNTQFDVPKYKGLTHVVRNRAVWTGVVRLDEASLNRPLEVRKPTMWFVNSMSDLFHEDLTWGQIDRVFEVMARCPQHTFQVLTKRADLMERYSRRMMTMETHPSWPKWPLPNVWLGVSVERQQEADLRIPFLLQTAAAVRWISAEPLLGPIELGLGKWVAPFTGRFNDQPTPQLDWVVTGGESGRGARLCNPSWIMDLIRQCNISGTPIFVKQLGANCGFRLKHPKGGDIDEFPEELRIRQWPISKSAAPAALLV